MKKVAHKARAILIDILGVLMLIGALLLGWIPGPGGIPLLLGGLALLAINHDWAKRLLERAKQEGEQFISRLFSEHPTAKIAFDVLSLVLFVVAGWLWYSYDQNLIRSIAVMLLILGLSLFLGNRKRLERIVAFVKRKT